jgi:putative DNA primase/helicase
MGDKKIVKENINEICHNISLRLIKQYNFKTIPGKKDDEIYVYDNGYYKDCGKFLIKSKVENQLGKICKTNVINEIINKIARNTFIDKRTLMSNNLNLLCLENGVLDIRNNKLLPHSPDYNFMFKIPVTFNPIMKCPNIIKFIEEILYEEDIDTIQEWFGYCLWRNYFLKKGMIFIGESDTGKTTMLNLLVKFIGDENISGISLQAIAGDKFSTARLYNKHLNIFDDMSANDLENVGRFKMVTGEGWISGEKKFGDEFQFRNFAKLTFATNRMPLSKQIDEDEAYYKRWLVIRFENVFDDNNKKTNRRLIDILTTKNEMSGLLNWSLIGLNRLLKNQKFSYNKDFFDIKNMILRNSSDVAKFIQDCCEKGESNNWYSKEEMYRHFDMYIKYNNLTEMTKEMFGRKFPQFCNWTMESRSGVTPGWRFVKVKDVKPIFGF